jgi:3-dehydroquinate dehydratase/shikimate dehydrogenase
MAKICLCLTGKTLNHDLELIEKNRKYIDLAELRVDWLDPDEHFYIRRFPELAGVPVILTIRRKADGGFFEKGEASRVALLSRGLAFAEMDKRHNFAYVDMEEDLEVPGLEEAVRTFGTRIIRSSHNLTGVGNVVEKIKNLLRIGDEIAKVAVTPHNLGDVLLLYHAARETFKTEKILFGMGDFGKNTRILAERLGSSFTYTSALEEPGILAAAPGQLSPKDMVTHYRFREISASTKIYGVVGYPLTMSYSPLIYNAVFEHEKIDAVYVPFPAKSLDNFLNLAEELRLEGVSVTIPYKEQIIPYLRSVSESVQMVEACNTIKAVHPKPEELFFRKNIKTFWNGINTDTAGFSESLLNCMGKKNFRGCKVTVLGAGGAARAVVSEICRLKGKCLILNRNPVRARELALRFNCKWGGMDRQNLDMMDRYSDIIIQTTPVGTFPHIDDDPFELYQFKGHETVMDLIYYPSMTAFLRRAHIAGCTTLNGLEMLILQAKHQYQYFFDREFPDRLIPRLKKNLRGGSYEEIH